jgi:hypothetical protein
VPGFGKVDERQKAVNALLASLKFGDAQNGIKAVTIGKGRILIGDDVEKLLNAANIRRETMTDNDLQFTRRKYKTGNSYFIANKGDKVLNAWVPVEVKAASVAIFDPMLKTSGLAKVRKSGSGNTEVYLQLQPGESCILQTWPTPLKGAEYPYFKTDGEPVDIKGAWTVKFTSGGPTLPQSLKVEDLKSWTEVGGDDLKAFSGTASYTIYFKQPTQNAPAWTLDLGKVYESADVYLNGTKLATLLGPQYIVTIPAAQLKPVNELEVRVSNLMANRIIDMEKKGIPYKIFYNTNFPAHNRENRGADGLFTAIKWDPKPSGLVGPVKLIPMHTFLP